MSTQVIDQKVVEMRFDNKDFEKNVSQSMSTIEKLKHALNFDSLKAFDGLGQAANNVDLSGINKAVDEASSKFSVLEIAGVTAIAKITSAAMDMGTSLVKSLSVDQISTGFSKYAEKTTAIQTIISATGESIEAVTEQIDKLNWFTDETSYNLTDMISNIAKFTNSGISLEKAVPQMMGIAAAAGDAGKGVQGATHAMEGFSKAMGQQYMSRQSWQWIRTAGLDTVRMKEAMIDAAVECGQLTQVAEGMWETLAGHEVTISDFESNLKDKWMNAEVMERGLQVYGDFANTLANVMDELGENITTSEFLEMIDQYKDGTLDLADAAERCEISETELKNILDDLASPEYDIGNHAFKMAQEAKTFAEAIDSVKDAVSTGWMTTVEYIFGNYEQAKKLWTALANDLYSVFAEGGNTRNAILGYWSEMGGRTELIQGLVEAVNLLVRPLSMVKQAFDSLFPDTERMGEILYNLSVRFHELMLELQPSEETMNDLYWVFKGLFSVVKAGLTLIGRLVKLIFPITKPLGSIAAVIVKILGYVGKFLYVVSELITHIRILPGFMERVRGAFGGFLDILKSIGVSLGGAIVTGVLVLVKVFSTLVNKVVEFVQTTHPLQTALSVIGELIQLILPILLRIGAVLAALVAGPIVLAVAGIVKLGSAIKDFVASAKPLETISNFLTSKFGNIGEVTAKLAQKIKSIADTLLLTFSGMISSVLSGNLKSAFAYVNIGATIASNKIKELFGSLKKVNKPVEAVKNTLQKTTKVVKSTTKEFNNANGQVEKATTVVKKMEDNYASANTVIAQSGTLTRETGEQVKTTTTFWEKLVNVLKGVGTVAAAVGLSVIGVIGKILTKVRDLFTKILSYAKQLLTGGTTIKELVNKFITGLVDNIKKLGQHFKDFLEMFGVDFDKIIEGFKLLGTNAAKFIHEIDGGKVAMLLFSAAMFGLAGAAIKLSSAFTGVFDGIKSFFGNINAILKKQFLKSTPLKDYAEALGLITGALIALTYVDIKYHDNLKNVAYILGTFAIIGATLTGVLTWFAAKIGDKKLSKEFETAGKIIIGLAGALVLMAGAMAILSKVDMIGNKSIAGAVVDWIAKLIVMFGMMGTLAVIAGAFQKFAPKLTISFLSMLALATAFYMMSKALAELGTIQFNNVQDNLWQLGAIMAAFGVLVAGIGKLKITSFANVLLMAKAIQILWPQIVAVYNLLCSDAIDPILEKAHKWDKAGIAIGAILSGVGVLLWGIGKLSITFVSLGVAATGLALGVKILVSALKSMSELMSTLSDAELKTVTNQMTKLVLTFGSVIAIINIAESIINLIGFVKGDKENKFKLAHQNFLGLAVAMVAFSGSMYIMVGALRKLYDLTKDIPTETQWKIVTMFNLTTLIFGLAIGLVGYAARGKHAVLILGGMFAMLGAMFSAMFTFYTMLGSDVNKTIQSFGLLTLVVIEIGALLKVIGGIKSDAPGKVILSLTAVLLSLGILVGAFAVLLNRGYASIDSIKNAGIVVGAISAALLAFVALFRLTSLIPADSKRLDDSLHIVGSLLLSVVVVAGSILALDRFGSDVNRMKSIAKIIGAFEAVLVVLTGLLTWLSTKKVEPARFKQTMTAFGDLVMAMVVFGAGLGILSTKCDVRKLMQTAIIIGALTTATTLLTGYLLYLSNKYKMLDARSLKTTFKALTAVVVEISLLSLAMGLLVNKTDVNSLGTAAIVIGLLSGACELMAGLLLLIASRADTVSAKGLIVTIVSLAAVVGEIYFLSLALVKLAAVDQGALREAAVTIGVLSIVMEAVTLLLANVSQSLANPYGLAGLAIAAAIILMACGLLITAGNAAAKAGKAFEQFAESMKILQTVNFLTIANGITTLASTASDLRQLSGAVASMTPHLGTLKSLTEIKLGPQVDTSTVNVLKEVTQQVSETGEQMTTTTVKVKENWADMTQEVQSGTLTLEESANDAAEAIGEVEQASASAQKEVKSFGSVLKESLTNVFNPFSSAKTGLDATLDMAGVTGETRFKIDHPIVSGIAASLQDIFNDAQMTGVIKSGAFPFGENMGNGILAGIQNSLATGLPGLAAAIQSMFGGVVSFNFSVPSYTDFIKDDIIASGKAAEMHTSNYNSLLKTKDAYEQTAANADKFAQKAGSPELAKATQMQNKYNNEVVKTSGWQGVLNNVMGEGGAVSSAFAKAEDYASETVEGLTDAAKEAVPAIGGVGAAMEDAGASGSKGAKGIKDFYSSLVSTLDGQLDIFSKFEIKTEMSAQTMLENMKSNIDGFASWSHRMTVLAERFAAHGIDQGLYQKLSELGPKGYETMNAFYQMSEEQLDEVRELYATSLTLPEGQADIVASGFEYMGEMSVQGFSNALDDHKKAHEAAHGLGKAALEGLEEALDTHSPSKETHKIGQNADIGLKNGIVEYAWWPKLAATNMAIAVTRAIKKYLDPAQMRALGLDMAKGLADGIEEGEALVTASTGKLTGAANKKVVKDEVIESPSHVWRAFGKYMGGGMALGIRDSAQNVIDAIDFLTSSAEDPLSGVLDTIGSYMGNDMSIVITPILDLSYLRAQMNEVNGMFREREIGSASFGQNEGTGDNPTTQINYTQNNYSPKALNRIDIFRQTKIQLATSKATMANF